MARRRSRSSWLRVGSSRPEMAGRPLEPSFPVAMVGALSPMWT